MTGLASDRVAFAVALIVTSVLLLSAIDAAVKAVSVVVLLALLVPRGVSRWHAILNPWVAVRSALMVSMWIAYYAALPYVPLSVAATGIYTSPLMIAVLSAMLVGEPVGRQRWLGISLGFIGVVVILRPGTDGFSPWTFLPILAAAFYALSAIVTRTRCASESALVLALGLHAGLLLVGAIGSLMIILIDPISSDRFLLGGWTPMYGRDWAIMAMLGLVMVVVATATARAYQSGPPAIVATFDYSYLVFATAWGALFFSEALDALTATGIVLIVIAGLIVLKRPGR